MYIHSTETIIPKYPFEPDEATGNAMFRINRNDCIVNYRRSDFLVPHRKDYYFMAFVRAGSSRHWIDMKPYVVKPDTYYFTDLQQINLKEEAGPMSGMMLSFTEEFLASDESGSLKKLPVIQNPLNGHELQLSNTDVLFINDTLERIHAEYNAKNFMQHNMLLAYMKVLLIYLSRLYVQQFTIADQGTNRLLLQNYLSKINECYTELHEVTDYAALLNISAGHLSELVKEQSGKSAIAHIHERLILEAKRLLFYTDHSVKEIAYKLGFEDDSYFNRFFKRLTHHTPSHYRSATREMYH